MKKSKRAVSALALCALMLLMSAAIPVAAETPASNSPRTENAAPEGWSQFLYLNAAGSTISPRDSSTGWDYAGAGCVSAVGGNDLFTLDVQIPQGARIDYLRIYYRDSSANAGRGWITTYNGAGGTTDLIGVDSTGSAGYGSALSAYLGHIVNNASSAYTFNWRASQTGSTMQLCGFRIAYRLPVPNVYLPMIKKG